MTSATSGLASFVMWIIYWVKIAGYTAASASLVLFIVYWVKIAGYSRRLGEEDRRNDDDYEDDLPPRRPARSDERIR